VAVAHRGCCSIAFSKGKTSATVNRKDVSRKKKKVLGAKLFLRTCIYDIIRRTRSVISHADILINWFITVPHLSNHLSSQKTYMQHLNSPEGGCKY